MKYAAKTSVPVERSKQEIERTLKRYGADQFASGWRQGAAVITFRLKNRYVRVGLPLPDRKAFSSQARFEQAERQRYRALALSIKAKLESVEAGIETFDSAFMSHIILPDGRTVGETLRPQIEEAYKSGKMPPLLEYGT